MSNFVGKRLQARIFWLVVAIFTLLHLLFGLAICLIYEEISFFIFTSYMIFIMCIILLLRISVWILCDKAVPLYGANTALAINKSIAIFSKLSFSIIAALLFVDHKSFIYSAVLYFGAVYIIYTASCLINGRARLGEMRFFFSFSP